MTKCCTSRSTLCETGNSTSCSYSVSSKTMTSSSSSVSSCKISKRTPSGRDSGLPRMFSTPKSGFSKFPLVHNVYPYQTTKSAIDILSTPHYYPLLCPAISPLVFVPSVATLATESCFSYYPLLFSSSVLLFFSLFRMFGASIHGVTTSIQIKSLDHILSAIRACLSPHNTSPRFSLLRTYWCEG